MNLEEELCKPLRILAKDNFRKLAKHTGLKHYYQALAERTTTAPQKAEVQKFLKLFHDFDSISLQERKIKISQVLNASESKPEQIKHESGLSQLKGIGSKIEEKLNKLKIQSREDLLHHFPIRYLDRSQINKISEVYDGLNALLEVSVLDARVIPLRAGRRLFQVQFESEGILILAKWFYFYGKSYLLRYQKGRRFLISGVLKKYKNTWQIFHPETQSAEELGGNEHDLFPPGIVPIYPAGSGLSSAQIKKLIENNLSILLAGEAEELPEQILSDYAYPTLIKSLQLLHFPNKSVLDQKFLSGRSPYHERIIFEEFFFLELALLMKKKGQKIKPGLALRPVDKLKKKVLDSLPFELTLAQKNALNEIEKDLNSPRPMHRLLQGDVGSGKTLVALLSSLMAYENGFQIAFMAPTEILAEQHYRNWIKILFPLGIEVLLLSSSSTKKNREKIKAQLSNQNARIIIGTHALIEEEVQFSNLALVIIDEQHRFGVDQRAKLMKKTATYVPDVLVMTATPIPRSLSLTVYGDLDLSLMKELPKGRQKIITQSVSPKMRKTIYSKIKEEIQAGRQAYFVYPLVKESEKLELQDAESAFIEISNAFPSLRIALLHGQMKSEEKDKVMISFARRELDILVATTVIEVGIDVPNATIILIEHAERFGLSQLHQLRGRVGRGDHLSYCYLMSHAKKSENARQRLKIMEETQDGFRISEEDLKIRGPGDFLGTRQSGLPQFRLAHIIRDQDLLVKARQSAETLLEQDPDLKEHSQVKLALLKRLEGRLGFAQIG